VELKQTTKEQTNSPKQTLENLSNPKGFANELRILKLLASNSALELLIWETKAIPQV